MYEIIAKDLVSGYYNYPVLNGISFCINEPGIYLVLGRNGAGKTTLFRTLAGIIPPLKGDVRINGKRPYHETEIRKKFAFLSHLNAIPEGFTVREILTTFASIEDVNETSVDEVVELVGIGDVIERYFNELSQGLKRRVSIAKSLLGVKDLYILDEPTTNLDPKVAADLRKFIVKISSEKVVLYSSQNLYEANELSSRILALDQGKLIYFGDIESIAKTKYKIGIRADGVEQVFPSIQKEGRYYIFDLNDSNEVQEVIDHLRKEGISIKEVKEMHNPLEDIFG